MLKFTRLDIADGRFPASALFRTAEGRNVRCAINPGADLANLPDDANFGPLVLPAEARDKITVHWGGMDMDRWEAIAHPPAPPATAADVEAEARRRISLVADVDERADMALEWQALRDKQAAGTLSDADKARAVELRSIWRHIEAIKATIQALAAQDPIPADYAAGARWPS